MCSGCSLIFVTPPPKHVQLPEPHPHVDCTSGRAAPIIDGLIAGYQLFRTAYAAQASKLDYAGSPIDRETDMLLGLGFSALFIGSTIYGTVNTSRCKRLKEGPAPGEEVPGRSDNVEERWETTPPVAPSASAPATAAPASPAQPLETPPAAVPIPSASPSVAPSVGSPPPASEAPAP